jgi:hypothetical protein
MVKELVFVACSKPPTSTPDAAGKARLTLSERSDFDVAAKALPEIRQRPWHRRC